MNSDVSVGDIVLYNHGVHETVMVSDQPMAAIVTYVHAAVKATDTDALPSARVNLAVFGKDGGQYQKHGVPLWDGEGDAPEKRLAFAYAIGAEPFADREPEGFNDGFKDYPLGDGEPADPNSDVVKMSTRGPNRLASGPASPVGDAGALKMGDDWNGDAPSSFDKPLVNPPVGPEYKPNAEHPMPNAPEPINKVPADSPANPDRPLD